MPLSRASRMILELPPRARRILDGDTTIPHRRGTTSAFAENTLLPSDLLKATGNYLRVRGEYGLGLLQIIPPTELPPRARRIPVFHLFAGQIVGTTSACAENTGFPPLRGTDCRNYLRVRGEYQSRAITGWDLWELPPRARRIQHHFTRGNVVDGTTSACAENTLSGGKTWFQDWNYLRVRGEYTTLWSSSSWIAELPPRARRIPCLRLGLGLLVGTTSACAENTVDRRQSRPYGGNYLRVRGEYPTPCAPGPSMGELPPRARRIPFGFISPPVLIGTTSACAENTSPRGRHERQGRNYLRVRGEYWGT